VFIDIAYDAASKKEKITVGCYKYLADKKAKPVDAN
jgi:hypothetical protein